MAVPIKIGAMIPQPIRGLGERYSLASRLSLVQASRRTL